MANFTMEMSKTTNRKERQMNTEEMGCIWKKISRNGIEYLSIRVQIGSKIYNFVAFENKYKQADNQPDYRIFYSKTN